MIEGTLRLTNSEMSCWRGCRRNWYLTYYRGLQKRDKIVAGRAVDLGTRVHNALAEFYTPQGGMDPREQVYAAVEADAAAYPLQEAVIRKEGKLALTMLEGYMEWLEETGADVGFTVLAAETKLEVPLFDGANLLSKLDARIQTELGTRLALEHKTVGSLKASLPHLQSDPQVLTEHLVEFIDLKQKGMDTERAGGVLYNQLRKVGRTAAAKPPFYSREQVLHNIHELRNHFRHCAVIGREIVAAHDALDEGADHQKICPPSPSRELLWRSPFYKDGIYGLMDDGSDWEAALDALYVKVDPLERYWGTTSYEEEA